MPNKREEMSFESIRKRLKAATPGPWKATEASKLDTPLVSSLQDARMARSESKMQIQIAIKELEVAMKQLKPYRTLPAICEALRRLDLARRELALKLPRS